MSLTPQLEPADVAALDALTTRSEREAAFESERIREVYDARGKRFVKGEDPSAPRREWQSLDAVLRSDANSAAALPERPLRVSRALAGLAIAGGLVMIAGAAATAREGLDLEQLRGPGAVMIGGAGLTLVSGVAAGITFGRAKQGYELAVSVYNDSLGLRLGLLDPQGRFIPPPGTLLDEDGFMILEDGVAASESAPTPHDSTQSLALMPRSLTLSASQ